MFYNQTFVCSAEKGYYTDIESEIFAIWKAKLKRHEEKVLLCANMQYRNEKRFEKVRNEKLKTV